MRGSPWRFSDRKSFPEKQPAGAASRCPFPHSPTVSEFADSAEKPGANCSNPGHFLCCQEAFGPHQSQNQNSVGPGTDPLMRDNRRPEGLKPPRFNLKPDVQTVTRGSNLLITLCYYHTPHVAEVTASQVA